MTFVENVTYWKSREVSMDSDIDEEFEAPKKEFSGLSSIAKDLIDHQEQPEGPSELVDMIVVLEIRKRLASLDIPYRM